MSVTTPPGKDTRRMAWPSAKTSEPSAATVPPQGEEKPPTRGASQQLVGERYRKRRYKGETKSICRVHFKFVFN
jgi:hypothetical protein